jgi:hypothetical protein
VTAYLAVVTNREGKPVELLRRHWRKAGTIELVHDVSKNELGTKVPPCGRFGANAAWFRLSLLTYNVLSAMKSLALPSELSNARPKRLRFSLFTIAGRIISSGGNRGEGEVDCRALAFVCLGAGVLHGLAANRGQIQYSRSRSVAEPCFDLGSEAFSSQAVSIIPRFSIAEPRSGRIAAITIRAPPRKNTNESAAPGPSAP